MKSSLTLPLRLKSENKFRRGDPRVHFAETARQRDTLLAALDEHVIRPGHWRTTTRGAVDLLWFTVTLCRISSGKLDDDNLRGAFKGTRDTVARWLGIDDADPRVTFVYDQEPGPRGKPGVRITIDDGQAEGGEHATILERLARPARRLRSDATPARGAGARGRKRSGARGVAGRAAPPSRSVAILPGPHDQREELSDVPALDGEPDPPKWIRVPTERGVFQLGREASPIVVDGERFWLYRGAGDPLEAAS